MVSGCDGEWRYGEWVVRGLGVVVRGCWGDLCGYYVGCCHDEWGAVVSGAMLSCAMEVGAPVRGVLW